MIELKYVTKKYGKHTIVRDVNCIYENGKVYGLIGYIRIHRIYTIRRRFILFSSG